MERENNLRICKMTDSNFMRMMEACIRVGAPMLLQEIGETLDPSLEPVLLKQVFTMVQFRKNLFFVLSFESMSPASMHVTPYLHIFRVGDS